MAEFDIPGLGSWTHVTQILGFKRRKRAIAEIIAGFAQERAIEARHKDDFASIRSKAENLAARVSDAATDYKDKIAVYVAGQVRDGADVFEISVINYNGNGDAIQKIVVTGPEDANISSILEGPR